MVFSKNFPRKVEGSNYPKWEEVSLSDEEEKEVSERARKENIELMRQCVDDAKTVVAGKGLKEEDVCRIAVALFEKRADHSVYWKERKAKEKFDNM